jgi:hypothetical protein
MVVNLSHRARIRAGDAAAAGMLTATTAVLKRGVVRRGASCPGDRPAPWGASACCHPAVSAAVLCHRVPPVDGGATVQKTLLYGFFLPLFALIGSAIVFMGVAQVTDGELGGLIFVALGCMLDGLVGFVVRATFANPRPTRTPPPGTVRRFRARRPFFTTITYAAFFVIGGALFLAAQTWEPGYAVVVGLLLLTAYVAFVFLVPPKGGRRTYLVTSASLIIEADGHRRTVPWTDIELVRHRPFVVIADEGVQERYDDRLELVTAGAAEPIVITGAHRQSSMSVLVVALSREHVLRRLLATFDRDGQVRLGELSMDSDGVQGRDGARLPWRGDWRVERGADEQGVALAIHTPEGQSVVGRVPEETVTRELLIALSGRSVPR